ncbi:hypothetical protein V8F33_008892 [Rhypophila sp. PSN 637]
MWSKVEGVTLGIGGAVSVTQVFLHLGFVCFVHTRSIGVLWFGHAFNGSQSFYVVMIISLLFLEKWGVK